MDMPENVPFQVLIDRVGDRVLLALMGEFNVGADEAFKRAVEEIEQWPFAELVVDLGGVSFMDSTAVYLLYDLYRSFSGRARVEFEGGSAQVQRMFEMAGLDRLMPIDFPGAAHPSGAPPTGTPQDSRHHELHPYGQPYLGLTRRDLPPHRH